MRFGTRLLFPVFMIGCDIHLLGSTIVFGFDYCRSRQENGIAFLINAPSSAIQRANECSAKCQSIANLKKKRKTENSIYVQSSHPAAFSYSFHLLLGVTSWLIAGLRYAFSRFHLGGESQIPHCTWCYEIALNKWRSLPLIKAGKCPFMSSATSKLKGKKICTYRGFLSSEVQALCLPACPPARLPACGKQPPAGISSAWKWGLRSTGMNVLLHVSTSLKVEFDLHLRIFIAGWGQQFSARGPD